MGPQPTRLGQQQSQQLTSRVQGPDRNNRSPRPSARSPQPECAAAQRLSRPCRAGRYLPPHRLLRAATEDAASVPDAAARPEDAAAQRSFFFERLTAGALPDILKGVKGVRQNEKHKA